MILGADGERLSKRHGATSVLEYKNLGFLPEGLLNYLARLGWSHGDEEMFSKSQFVEWFDLEHVSRSAAQFDPGKLAWLNQQYLKAAGDARLAAELKTRGFSAEGGPALERVVALLKERATTLVQLADEAMLFYQKEIAPAPAVGEDVAKALRMLESKLASVAWERGAINEAIKQAVKASGLKMPQLAMPLRQLVTGRSQTPSIDAVLELIGREKVLARMAHYLGSD